ncbi:MAG TPA: hypothetical protein VM555_06070 [Tahibacter sp.]|jgi:hypothetical protein|nr:hypothetical protein [Tahibacter sp.]
MKLQPRLSTAALLMLGVVVSPFANAEDVYVKSETASVVVPVGPLDAEFLAKTIDVDGPRTLVIHYAAECQVERGHVEYDIVVNQGILAITARQASPTHDDTSALCSNDGDTLESNMRASSVGMVVACTVASASKYTVKVRGHVKGPGAIGPGLVDDQSLVIEERGFSLDVPPCVNALPGFPQPQ